MIILEKAVVGISQTSLTRFLTRAKRAAEVDGQVNVLITSSRKLRALNRRFRCKDKATDVLSFPSNTATRNFGGDIAISLDIACDNAHRLGHEVADELKVLILHGVLHLAGHDHEADNGNMARLENLLRKELALPAGLIERAHGKNRHSSAPDKRSTRRKKVAR
jgi:probable rRNA maturation factor